ncbi:nuclear pore glycoprotein p62 [Nilaparvata lugens]|uniref:nuclear pore glycoprotein p62 n=1 Tax=Nilaparvata lugens TaxID=108931 RepID=UPI00193DD17F|nr:nuclear pore glycoprotein p62 [Nilaparvata lugens]XP_039276370.1 nuclear pore glycoprotein p62 [Nilaparvata lugens]
MTTNFTFGTGSQATGKPAQTSLFSMPTASSQAPTGGFSLGGTGDNKSTGLNLTTTATTQAQQKPLGFTMPTMQPSVAATTTSAAASTTGFSLAGTPSTPFSTSSLFPAASTTAPPPTLSLKTTVAPPSTTAATSLVTSTNVTAAPTSIGTGTSMNFVQLEETINKWTMELEEQEKLFVNQNTQLIAWDMQLVKNGEKIVELNKSLIEVKLLQQQLDHELDFILAQQRELDECLGLLSKELSANPVNIDAQREHTYHMAESLDTQLKQMSEDLKEIIEHLNESNRTQDSNDPVIQIGHILNAHMNSLQWVDDHVIQIQNKLDEVTKLHDVHRRENERSF